MIKAKTLISKHGNPYKIAVGKEGVSFIKIPAQRDIETIPVLYDPQIDTDENEGKFINSKLRKGIHWVNVVVLPDNIKFVTLLPGEAVLCYEWEGVVHEFKVPVYGEDVLPALPDMG